MKRFFTWKVFRRLLIGFTVFITLIAVAWAIENYRGRSAWAKYKAELEAKGEKLELKAFIPPPVPDERNFALASIFQTLDFSSAKGSKDSIKSIGIDIHLGGDRKTPPAASRDFFDLEAYQEFYRANTNYPQSSGAQSPSEDILLALSRFDEDLDRLRKEAAERPLSRFPLRYEDNFEMLLPHLTPMSGIVKTLHLRGAALLELGRNEEAFQEAQLALRLADSIQDDGILVSFLVRMAMLQKGTALLKEGIVRHAWSDQQLIAFQDYFAATDLLGEYHTSIRAERAISLELLEDMGRGALPMSVLLHPMDDSRSRTGGWWLPMGWLRQNQKAIAQMHQEFSIEAVDPKERRVFPEIPARGKESVLAAQGTIPNPHKIFAQMLVPAILKVSQRTAENQTVIDHASVACALERFYIANKQYPTSLQELVPQHINTLPHDLVTGGPLKYKRTSNGFYRLYSTGWDGKDDGGQSTEDPRKDKDWVWQFPEEK